MTPPERLAADLGAAKVRQVLVSKIVVKATTLQPRCKTDAKLVREYAQAMKLGVKFPAVVAAEVRGTGTVLIDGHHRVAAAEKAGRRHLDAKVLKGWSMKDLACAAAALNLTHGKALSRSEKKVAFHRMMRAGWWECDDGRVRSLRDLAGLLGGSVAHQTIWRWIAADYPKLAAAMSDLNGRGGGPMIVDLSAAFPTMQERDEGRLREVRDALRNAYAAVARIQLPMMAAEALWEMERALSEIREGVDPTPLDNHGGRTVPPVPTGWAEAMLEGAGGF